MWVCISAHVHLCVHVCHVVCMCMFGVHVRMCVHVVYLVCAHESALCVTESAMHVRMCICVHMNVLEIACECMCM